MRRSIVVGALSFLILLTNAAASGGTPGPKFNPPKTYYLALGDSFSFGYQVTRLSTPPDPAAFDHGFVDDLGVYLRRIAPAITTINYGCSGESTVTFIEGGCPWTAQGYPLHDTFVGTQLDAAVEFLQAHPGEVSPITISLALNDVQRFITDCGFDPLCIQQGAPATARQIIANLATILERLRDAAPNVEIIVLGPYDPFISNLEFADPLFIVLNDAMAETAAVASARYADIFGTFNPQGDIDAEIQTLCMLTLWCTHGDGHPSDLGYQLMADTIFEVSGYERLLDGKDVTAFPVRSPDVVVGAEQGGEGHEALTECFSAGGAASCDRMADAIGARRRVVRSAPGVRGRWRDRHPYAKRRLICGLVLSSNADGALTDGVAIVDEELNCLGWLIGSTWVVQHSHAAVRRGRHSRLLIVVDARGQEKAQDDRANQHPMHNEKVTDRRAARQTGAMSLPAETATRAPISC